MVLVSMGGGFHDRTIHLPAQVATRRKKTIKGALFGDRNPTSDIPRLLGLYMGPAEPAAPEAIAAPARLGSADGSRPVGP